MRTVGRDAGGGHGGLRLLERNRCFSPQDLAIPRCALCRTGGGLCFDDAETRQCDLRRLHAGGRLRIGATRLGLGLREPAHLAAQLDGTLGAGGDTRRRGRLDIQRQRAGRAQARFEPRREVLQPPEQRRVERALAQVRDGREGALCVRGARRRVVCRSGSRLGPRGQLVGLVGQGSPARVHLQEHGLGRVAGEPELAPRRIEAEALFRHRRRASVEQVVQWNDRQRGHELLRISSCEHRQAAEPSGLRPLEQLEPSARIGREHCRSEAPERGRHGPLRALIDLDRGQGDPLSLLGERSCRRRQTLVLADRMLERGHPLVGRACPLGEIVPLRCRGPGDGRSLVGESLQLGGRQASAGLQDARLGAIVREPLANTGEVSKARPGATAGRGFAERLVDGLAIAPDIVEALLRSRRGLPLGDREPRLTESSPFGGDAARLCGLARKSSQACRLGLERTNGLVTRDRARALVFGKLFTETLFHCCCRFASERDPLGDSLQSVQRGHGCLALPGGIGKLVLDLLALLEQRLQAFLSRPPDERRRGTLLLRDRTPFLDLVEVDLRDPRVQAVDLDGELLRPLCRRRLQCQRAQPLPHLVLDVARPVDLRCDTGELELRTVLAALELSQSGCLLQELAPIGRSGREHGVDLPLRDDRVHRPAEADVGE